MNVALFPAASGVEKDLESAPLDKYGDSIPFAEPIQADLRQRIFGLPSYKITSTDLSR